MNPPISSHSKSVSVPNNSHFSQSLSSPSSSKRFSLEQFLYKPKIAMAAVQLSSPSESGFIENDEEPPFLDEEEPPFLDEEETNEIGDSEDIKIVSEEEEEEEEEDEKEEKIVLSD